MSNFSGLSAILTVSLVAILTVQMLKDKFDIIENYGEHDDEGNHLAVPYMGIEKSQNNIQETAKHISTLNRSLSDVPPHPREPFVTGDFFTPPYVQQGPWNSPISEAFSMMQSNTANSTPTADQLNAISSTQSLPGPNSFTDNSFANANVNTGRAKNLSLCSQNFSMGVGNTSVASSLLPSPNVSSQEGFEDCNESFTNALGNQAMLSSSGQIGTDTVGSLRNTNQSLRSEPPNPMMSVSPWLNSTIYPDLLRRPLEGCGPSFGLYGNGVYSSVTPTQINS
jgi:hypothetical protein